MIFLIDEKTERQEVDYAWTQERFNEFHGMIHSISSYEALENGNLREEIFTDDSIILFHESFFDNVLNNHPKDSRLIREKLTAFTEKNVNSLVYFSGSKVDRHISGNIAHLPVSVLYQNLEVFLSEVKGGNIDLRNLLFGRDFSREKKLLHKIQDSNSTFDLRPLDTTEVTFLALSLEDEIPVSIQGSRDKTFFTDDQFNHLISDEYLDQRVQEWFNDETFDKIFIPLCFGNVLSDFNGLRLALHIRTTDTKNILTPLFIYAPVEHRDFLHNNFYDVLKTRNIFLISYSREGFLRSLAYRPQKLEKYQLPAELAKINLKVPSNYEDSHSVTNEWAIYRWARTLDTSDEAIEKINRRVKGDSYFKYLKTRFPVLTEEILPENKLKIDAKNNPRILLIDDEANKGWYENLCKVFYDINGFEFSYLDIDFKTLPQEVIIEKGIEKLIECDADIVLLDFRLHPSDFLQKDISGVTGLKLLKRIKDYNPGIQVIIFSATNKIWNLQAIQEAGANGFILKESPHNSIKANFTKDLILQFINILSRKLELIFLKEFYKQLKSIEERLIPRKKHTHEKPLPKEFVDESLKWLRLSNDIISEGTFGENKISDAKLMSSFLFKFSVLENLASRIINVDFPIEDGKDESGRKKFKFEFRVSDKRLKNFVEDVDNPGFYRKTKSTYRSARNIPWHIKILNILDHISDESLNEKELNAVIRKRNDFVHSNTTTGTESKIDYKDVIFLNNIIIKGLKDVV